ncbi:T9SS type A sorting domain-containing protein [Psychroserpens sp. S379A]|uniref:T9SS type A sorting domain-containing protein n=1 Tax=Psychroserpens sp. S379A TaxID=3415137 RepID=UPI003C7D4432
MKKITLSLCFVLLSSVFLTMNAQVLNQNANWPNAGWSITGTYNADPTAFEADPTVGANFAYDDDDAGNPSDDDIAAESPIIDLTAAFNAGETWITVTADYVYRYLANDDLRFQYWDADSATWENWGSDFDLLGNETVLTDDFCAGTGSTYTSDVLNIAAFTATQQSGFRYRIAYDDDPAGGDWNYGFCFQSPTITSATPPSCADPSGLVATTLNTTDVTLEWVENGTAMSWDIEIVDVTAGGTQTMTATYSGVTSPYTETMLTPGNDYEFYVQADCDANGTSNWVGPLAWSQPLPGNVCESAIVVGALPYNTSDDTANYGDDYDGAPGTDCGTANNYLNGDDVVYEYTATSDTSINVSLSNIGSTYTGIFAYNDCTDIGVMCATIGDNYDFNDGVVDLGFDLNVTNGETYYIVISTWASPQSTTYTLDITENSCVDATVAYSVVDDCDNSGGFNIVVDVTDLGSSTSLDIDDDQGSATQSTGVTGMFTFGPYVNGTDVVISITDNDDANCNQTSNALTQTVCPVSNDDCADAIDLDPFANSDGTCTMVYSGSNAGATNSAGEVAPSGACSDGDATPADVWFTLTVPASGEFDFEFITNPGFSTLVELYTGTCGSLTALDPVLCNNAATRTFTGLTPGETVYLRVWDYGSDEEGVLEVCVNYLNCAPATVTYTVEEDCAISGGFNILVDVTDLGTSTSLDINDDQGSATQSTGVVGMFTFGPYVNGTDVVISITDNDDGDCSQASGTLTQVACPPVNDDCSGALALTPGADFAANAVDGTVVGATIGSEVAGCGTNGPGVWYSVVVPADGNITLETGPDIATDNQLFDSVIEAFSGTCGALTSIECDDDDAATGNFSLLDLTGLTPGETIYLRVWEYGGNESEPFAVSAYNSTLSIDDYENQNAFTYFPNPVKNTLTLTATQNIQNISVLNILGQEVLRSTPNAFENVLDMNSLKSGSYFVKVTINDVTETVRVIKK